MKIISKITLGQLIKRERIALGMQQQELADLLGITYPYMSQIESGRHKRITDAMVIKLSDILGVKKDDLYIAQSRWPQDMEVHRSDVVAMWRKSQGKKKIGGV